MRAAELLECLAGRREVSASVALVVAHPDDETIGAGASLGLFGNLLLVHVTDGAPRTLDDARAAGFDTAAAYAQARRGELDRALAVCDATPEVFCMGMPDQQAAHCISAIVERLKELFAAHRVEAVLTHAYEGGHPDHDAVACGVHLACAETGIAVVEMGGYHAGADGGMRVGCFLDNGGEPMVIALSPAEQAAKRAMLDCFVTQAATLAPFETAREVFRVAPVYDFRLAPHEGLLNYERHDWGVDGAGWRRCVAQVL